MAGLTPDSLIGKTMKATEAIQAAVDLAEFGLGFVAPNPPVGCVILSKEGVVIGAGYHTKYGEAHAEVEAYRRVEDPSKLSEATMYVTLEPCSFEGNTPSCAKMVAANPVKKVIFGLYDPHPKVQGAGEQILVDIGVETATWDESLNEQALKKLKFLMEPFFVNQLEKRAFIALKAAVSLDGQMAMSSGESQWITGEEARKYGHLLRAHHGCLLTGAGTLNADNPRLTVRHEQFPEFKNKVIVFDPKGQYKNHFESSDLHSHHSEENLHYIEGVSAEELPKNLFAKGISQVMVEAGPKTLSQFIANGEFDRLYLFTAPKIVGSDQSKNFSGNLGFMHLNESIQLSHYETYHFGNDILNIYSKISSNYRNESISN